MQLTINFVFMFSDDDSPDQKIRGDNSIQGPPIGPNPFLETPQNAAAIEYKKGYVMRKCCYDSNYKKSEFSLIYYGFTNFFVCSFLSKKKKVFIAPCFYVFVIISCILHTQKHTRQSYY